MRRILIAAVLLAVTAATVNAAPARRKCPPNCKHRVARSCPAPTRVDTVIVIREVAAPASFTESRPRTLWQQLGQGIYLAGGFRWEATRACPTCPPCIGPPPADPPIRVVDPFYLGAGVRVPLASRVDLAFEWNRDVHTGRDFIEEPLHQSRLFAEWHPWRSASREVAR